MGLRAFPEKGDALKHCLDARLRRLEAGPRSNRARNQDMETSYHTSRISKEDPANSFKRSWVSEERDASKGLQSPSLLRCPEETEKVEIFTTLKRVCPSEYQGAQGAFKDSMIH